MSEGKELVRRLFEEVFNERNGAVCDQIVAAAYVEHAVAPFGDTEPGSVDGPEHMRGVVDWLVAQFPDLTMQVERLVGDGDTVAALVLSEGTNLGPFNGVVPPTGKRFRSLQSHWYRITDGKLCEHWAVREDLPTMLQLGILQRPGPPA